MYNCGRGAQSNAEFNGSGDKSWIINQDHVFNGDSAIIFNSSSPHATIGASGGDTSNVTITDGTLSVSGIGHSGIVDAARRGTLNFYGDNVKIYSMPGSDVPLSAYTGGRVNFHNAMTEITGDVETAILLHSRNYLQNIYPNSSIHFYNGFSVGIDRTSVTDSADKVRGLYAWSGAEFTADGEAEISVQASETDGSVRAIEVDLPDEGKTVQVTFNNNAQISAIGGVTSAYGVYALRGGGTAFYGGGSITAKDAGRQNVAVYATGEGTTFNSDGNLKAEGIGGSSYAMGMWFDTNMQATLSGYTEAIGRDSAGTNYGFYAGGGAGVEVARAHAKASGGQPATARGTLFSSNWNSSGLAQASALSSAT